MQPQQSTRATTIAFAAPESLPSIGTAKTWMTGQDEPRPASSLFVTVRIAIQKQDFAVTALK
jgi:hypothetical protein